MILRKIILFQLTRKLRLSHDQQRQANELLHRAEHDVGRLRDRTPAEVETAVAPHLDQLMAVLNPEQREQADVLLADARHRWGAPRETSA